MKKKNIFIIYLLCLLIIIVNIISTINHSNDDSHLIRIDKNFNTVLTKIIIIGDSRMDLLNREKETLHIPNNIMFIARSGARIIWLDKVAIPLLREELNNKNSKYKYMVLFNLGVNDINSDAKPSDIARDYLIIYNNIIFENPDVNFYFLSVNPIDEKIINNYFHNQKRTNKRIEEFNQYIISSIKKYNNISYCDSYNDLNINFYDGLHFDFQTNKSILYYLINDCFRLNNFYKIKTYN